MVPAMVRRRGASTASRSRSVTGWRARIEVHPRWCDPLGPPQRWGGLAHPLAGDPADGGPRCSSWGRTRFGHGPLAPRDREADVCRSSWNRRRKPVSRRVTRLRHRWLAFSTPRHY